MIIRPMLDQDADAVATKVHGLARDLKLNVTPRLTGAGLRASLDLVNVMVAADDEIIVGACLWLMTYSTFRGARGMYVVDLFVDGAARNRNIGLKLLKASARTAVSRGATFIKLEVDTGNEGGARFYERLGFNRKNDDRLFILENDDLDILTREKT